MKEAGSVRVADGAEESFGGGGTVPHQTPPSADSDPGFDVAAAPRPGDSKAYYRDRAAANGVVPGEGRSQESAIAPAGTRVGSCASVPLPAAWAHQPPPEMGHYYSSMGAGPSGHGAAMVPIFGPNMMGRPAAFPHPMVLVPGHGGSGQGKYAFYPHYPPIGSYGGAGHAPYGHPMMAHVPPPTGPGPYAGASLSDLPFKPAPYGHYLARTARGGRSVTAPVPEAHTANLRGGHLLSTSHSMAMKGGDGVGPDPTDVAARVRALAGSQPGGHTSGATAMPKPRKPVSRNAGSRSRRVKDKQCTGCGTRASPTWRRSAQGSLLCNACGLWEKRRASGAVSRRRARPAPTANTHVLTAAAVAAMEVEEGPARKARRGDGPTDGGAEAVAAQGGEADAPQSQSVTETATDVKPPVDGAAGASPAITSV